MAKNKKGASASRGAKNTRGGRGVHGGRGASRGQGNYSSTPPRVSLIRESVGFTLADEARQTSQHDHSTWGNSSLRLRPVAFVSAGPSEPLKLLDEITDKADEVLGMMLADTEDGGHTQPAEQDCEHPTDEDEFIGPDDLEQAIQAETVPEESTLHEPSFFFDLKGDKSQKKQNQPPVEIPERPSSRSSTSSEEVLLFKGRGAQRKAQPVPDIDMVQMQTEIRVVEEAIITKPAPLASSLAPEQQVESANKNKKQKRHEKRNAKTRFEDEEDAILADYIANIKENTDVDDYFKELLEDGRDSDDSGVSEPSSANGQHDPSYPNGAEGDASNEDTDDDAEVTDGDEIPSEIDDETLARLIAGHGFGQDLGMEDVNFGDSSSDSDSDSDQAGKQANQRQVFEDDFDLMDWDRPSLRRRKGKGARAQISFNVSDSELEASLQASWKNDRLKKSERKKQREEMRALGMLGKNANPEDLRIKYPDGMNMEQVADEMRTFLIGTDEQLNFPPMDNNARKMIHELANKFKLKSKSIGKAEQRRPTLHRTGRTPPYIPATFDQAFNRVNRKYLPRLNKKGKKGKCLPPLARGGTSTAAATYQDGEVVGASAPELGIENRGRAMLEKMGWSLGTALGATNNKGIMQPVTHTMKRTKAGLG
ncbi:Protein SQS1 [Fusarium austroafricanum]|uniref:Protein SQS1 n=1 Tax=Fusarium austroafricanum TaxID=2364996 RepID=A0A8H4KLT4_9HYPO|nr:Protein SQS1 [Fusarium austroafricanum]